MNLSDKLNMGRAALDECEAKIDASASLIAKLTAERDAARADATALRTQLDMDDNDLTVGQRLVQRTTELHDARELLANLRLQAHDSLWANAAEILGLHKDAGPAEILSELRMCVVASENEANLAAGTGPVCLITSSSAHTQSVPDYILDWGGTCRDCGDENGVCPNRGLFCDGAHARRAVEYVLKVIRYGLANGYLEMSANAGPALANGTGPVSLPDTAPATLKPGDFTGLQKIVAQHSRDIPDLRETVRSLSSTVAKLRSTMDASGKAR